MSWIALLLCAVFLSALSSLLQRVLMKADKSDPFAYSVVFQILGGLVIGAFATVKGFVVPPFAQYPINFLLLTILYGSGTVFLFNAYKYLEASEVTILTSVRSIVVIATAVFLLGEAFNFQKVVGTFLILLSVFLLSKNIGRIKFNKGILYVLGMALCYGSAITNDAYLLPHVDVFSYTAVGFFLPGLFLVLVKPKVVLQLKPFLNTKIFAKMLALVLC
ncbi:DMT family transporter [Candidatus Curtissbacteria bacterium]|nr:DMT family transporter [Candidatus Curtissbacteria bacterium]